MTALADADPHPPTRPRSLSIASTVTFTPIGAAWTVRGADRVTVLHQLVTVRVCVKFLSLSAMFCTVSTLAEVGHVHADDADYHACSYVMIVVTSFNVVACEAEHQATVLEAVSAWRACGLGSCLYKVHRL
jgi:putative copper export protein